MRWISAFDLGQWADRVSARTDFPDLIRQLIVASASDISDMRFPGGEKGQVRGFDGWLESSGAPPYVPAGHSIWEFGVSSGPAAKFAADYKKRVDEIPADKRKDMTFVFASPRTWDAPTPKLPDFVQAYRDKGDFKDVRYIDGAQLEDWLERSGAVAARHARDVAGRVPQFGARSTDEFWEEYRRRFRPPVTEDVVLAARDTEATNIVTHLLGHSGLLMFQADGPDEVAAVAVAAIRKSDGESRAYLESRTLVVETDEAGRTLAEPNRYGFVLTPGVSKTAGLLSSVGPAVAGVALPVPGQGHTYLTRPSTREMAQALGTMDYDEEGATRLAQQSGRSLTILERHIPAADVLPPAWVAEGANLIPALLAGGWDSRREGDKEILAELARVEDYLVYEAKIRGLVGGHDAPLDREAGVWKLRAPVDVLVHLSRLLGPEHLEALTRAAIKIFTAPAPDMSEERFGVSQSFYSSRLRDGMANTLLMIAVYHSEAGLTIGDDPTARVNEMIAGLPGLKDDIRVIASLERQLPMLMEASPDPLLAALEHLLEGDVDAVAELFVEAGGFGQSAHNLPQLLWALEMLAWDPRYLRRVALVLARLAAIDPGGKSGNRPGNSLRDIFVAWKPGTNASLAVRLTIVDEITALFPAVGWDLVVGLLPKSHDAKGPTQMPRYREAGASERERLTIGAVAETYEAVIDRALALVGSDVAHWIKLLESFSHFSPDRRGQFLDMLAGFAATIDGEAKIGLRRKIRSVVDRHGRFRDAKWAIPKGDLDRLATILAALEAVEPIEQARTLFDEMSPFATSDFKESERLLAERREAAVGRIFALQGGESVLRLAARVRWPDQVASTASKAISSEDDLFELVDLALRSGGSMGFATSLAGSMRWQRDSDFDQRFLEVSRTRGWSAVQTASLMLNWPEEPTTWRAVETLGEEAASHYWRQREPRSFAGDAADLIWLIEKLLQFDRASAALSLVYNREDDLPWDVIQRLLAALVKEINAVSEKAGELDDYYVEELFKKLRARADVPRVELAQWEYAYFPMLEHRDHDLVIFDLMAGDPEFFVSILKDVFIADDADPNAEEPDPIEPHRGTAAYRVLTAFDKMPGATDGTIEPSALDAWVGGMIDEAMRQKRMNVVYSYIGRALAHAEETDGLWPPAPVADIIERLASSDLEQGLSVERYNMRGVYTKALFEGGKQEKDLAAQYLRWREAQPSDRVRTRAMLAAIADGWTRDARRADEEASRDRLRFD